MSSLENVISNANTYGLTSQREVLVLEENLNTIYKICYKNRRNYLPFGTTQIQESELKNELEKALNDSALILSDLNSLASKNFSDKFDINSKMNRTQGLGSKKYLYPKYISDFEVAKKYVQIEEKENHIHPYENTSISGICLFKR